MKRLVSEDVEIILDGRRILLERGDQIDVNSDTEQYPVADSDSSTSIAELKKQHFNKISGQIFFDGSVFYFLMPKEVAFAAGEGPEMATDKAFLPLRVD